MKLKPTTQFKLHKIIVFLTILSLLITACGGTATVSTVTNDPAPAPVPPVTTDSAVTTTIATESTATTTNSTPIPDFLPADAQLVITPVPAPAAPGSEIYRTFTGPTGEEILSRLENQGWVECPEEEVYLLEDGIAFVCPGEGADSSMAAAILLPAVGIAMTDSPAPGPSDLVAVTYVLVSGALVLTTGYALSQMPRVLMARNPNTLPPVVVPDGVPAPPEHLQNHPSGPFASKLKSLGWVAVMTAWFNFAHNGGPEPDFCGKRPSDGAMLIVYYGLQVATLTGRIYQGFGAIVNMGATTHDSTVLIKLQAPEDGVSHTSNNTGRDDFSEFTPLPPDQCGPPPLTVAR